MSATKISGVSRISGGSGCAHGTRLRPALVLEGWKSILCTNWLSTNPEECTIIYVKIEYCIYMYNYLYTSRARHVRTSVPPANPANPAN
jgi:hypothetical protein